MKKNGLSLDRKSANQEVGAGSVAAVINGGASPEPPGRGWRRQGDLSLTLKPGQNGRAIAQRAAGLMVGEGLKDTGDPAGAVSRFQEHIHGLAGLEGF